MDGTYSTALLYRICRCPSNFSPLNATASGSYFLGPKELARKLCLLAMHIAIGLFPRMRCLPAAKADASNTDPRAMQVLAIWLLNDGQLR